MRWGNHRRRLLALLAVPAMLAGLLPGAAAATADPSAGAALGGATVATLADREYHNCLDSDYNGHVYLNPCGKDNYFQQWQAVARTLVNVHTGLCLDSNDKGDIYTRICDGSPYQNWGGGGLDVIGNVQTKMVVTAMDPHSVRTGAYLDFDAQHWDQQLQDGVCDPEPLSMVIDQVLPDTWKPIGPTQQSTEGIAGKWEWSVTQGNGTHVTAQTSSTLGAEFTVEGFKASASETMTKGVTADMTYSVTTPFHANVPKGEVMYANYGAHHHNVIFHWHRLAKDCTDLNSGQYSLEVPFAQGFYWNCDTRLDANCEQAIRAANSSVTARVLAEDFYPFYALLKPGTGPTPPDPPVKKETSVAYTGPRTAAYHDSVVVSAKVGSGGKPVGDGLVTFDLGRSSCVSGVGPDGGASCRLTITDSPGATQVQVRYGGAGDFLPSSTSAAFTITREATKLAYTGTSHIANGEPAQLSAVLTENGQTSGPIADRVVHLALGEGGTRQACDAKTDASGAAKCTIPSADQPLNDTATVPVTATFDGDAFYLPSADRAQARLQYYTGQASGLAAKVNLPLLPIELEPSPDTGPIRTATATRTDTPCTASTGLLVLHADALCPSVSTKLNPGEMTSTVRVGDVHIGLPGVPVIDVSALTATSTSSCTSASASATMKLTVAGTPIEVPTAPNSVIPLPGGGRIVVNEQTPVSGADFGVTERALHVVVPGLTGNLVDVTVGAVGSASHNCR
ncbi:choice-of-anchor P family protein [Amycolatopsis jejuensis]|uniref:choice-of-anchor P family protein n=1 Tax=Amycolatopsis jejuensis TaxID=330084 RepID=UPI0012E01DEE|nr:choice-of-anchor P family protein [Amycolatopsis jejuensis]